MSKAVMESVIGKIILDTELRYALLANADQVLDAFDLSSVEKIAIKHLDNETLEYLARILNAHLDKFGQDSIIAQQHNP